MRTGVLKLLAAVQCVKDEAGQDLVEYALIVALIALAATAALNGFAATINTAFTTLAARLNSAIT